MVIKGQNVNTFDADQVKGLGGDGTDFTVEYDEPWFSGMLDIQQQMPEKEDYHLHYWFFPSARQEINDPVLLWLNGGPGMYLLLTIVFD